MTDLQIVSSIMMTTDTTSIEKMNEENPEAEEILIVNNNHNNDNNGVNSDRYHQNMELLNILKRKIDLLSKQLALQRRCIGSIGSFERFLDVQLSMNSTSILSPKNNDNNSESKPITDLKSTTTRISNSEELDQHHQRSDHDSESKEHEPKNLNTDDRKKLFKIKEFYERFAKTFHYLRKRCHRIEVKKRPTGEIYNCLYELFDSMDRAAKNDGFIGLDHFSHELMNPRSHDDSLNDFVIPDKDSTDMNSDSTKVYICPKDLCGRSYKQRGLYIKHIQLHLKKDPDPEQKKSTTNGQNNNNNSNDYMDIDDDENLINTTKTSINKKTCLSNKSKKIKELIVNTRGRPSSNKKSNDSFCSKSKTASSKKSSSRSGSSDLSGTKSKSTKNSRVSTATNKRKANDANTTGGKIYECQFPECDYKTKFKSAMDLHRNKHSSARPFECEICHKTFKNVYALRMHVLVHQNQRFHCPYEGCDAVYSWFYTLKKHIRVHNNQAPVHRCDWPGCDYQTHRPDLLRKHRTRHTGERKFHCQWPDCGKAFKTESGLFDHLSMHKNERKHACTWPGCNYRCNLPGNLRKHIATHEKKLAKTSSTTPNLNNNNNNSTSSGGGSIGIHRTDSTSILVPHQTMLIHEEGNIHF